MPRLRMLAQWALRAAVTAAVLAYISYDVDHAEGVVTIKPRRVT
jgi:hypothetical protein